jgi:hypothetical protein
LTDIARNATALAFGGCRWSGPRTPSLFLFPGNVPPDADPNQAPANHSPMFELHEPNLVTGMRIFRHLVV